MDSKLRTPLDANFLDSHPEPWIATTEHACPDKASAFRQRGISVLEVASLPNGWVDPVALQAMLLEREVKSVMVEGGAHILTTFLQHHLADYLVATISMKLLGGLHSLLGLPAGHAAPQLQDWKTVPLGDDLIVGGKLLWT
jgi:riboflavin biosynthesis pyrimidine reductase